MSVDDGAGDARERDAERRARSERGVEFTPGVDVTPGVDSVDASRDRGAARAMRELVTSSWMPADLWGALALRGAGERWMDGREGRDGGGTSTARDDVELCVARRALERALVAESRLLMSRAMAQWRSACTRRVGNERAATCARRRNARRFVKRFFERWRAQTPNARRAWDGWGTNRFGVSSGTAIGEEFPTDYRAELEIRLSQIARLEEALREATAKNVEQRERAENANAEVQMEKFREHLQNLQRELEGVKRERDTYRKKWESSSGPSAAKAAAERRANQRTMATQTVWTEEGDRETRNKEVETAKKSQIRAAEERWMEQARLFEQKFERQMQVASEYETKLREERARFTRSEASFEAKIEEMAAKHAEEIANILASRSSLGATASGGGSGDFSRERFVEYAKIGAETATARQYPDVSPIFRSPSPEPETFASPSMKMDADEHDDVDEHDAPAAAKRDEEKYAPTHFQSSTKLTFAEFSSEDERDDRPGDDDDVELRRASSAALSPPLASSFTKKPLRLTVAVAKLVVLGHSQRDAIEALKHVDNNDVHAALAWLERSKRVAA